jgi:hypothetical protein
MQIIHFRNSRFEKTWTVLTPTAAEKGDALPITPVNRTALDRHGRLSYFDFFIALG